MINDRALTIELVDIFYGIAYLQKPVGAYRNQGIGAGLYVQLVTSELVSEIFNEKNLSFLNISDLG